MPEGHRFSPEGTARKFLRVICFCRITQVCSRPNILFMFYILSTQVCFPYSCELVSGVFIFPLRIGRITREVNLDKISYKYLSMPCSHGRGEPVMVEFLVSRVNSDGRL